MRRSMHMGRQAWIQRALLLSFLAVFVAGLFLFGRAQATTSSSSSLPNYLERAWYVSGNYGGLTADGAGNVYVTRATDISMFSGDTPSTTDPDNPTLLKTWTGFTAAGDITIDEQGLLYVTDGNTVKQFDSDEPSGEPTILKTWTGFSSPWGIDIDDDGDIVVANNTGGTYRMFNRSAAAGAVSTKNWTGVNDAWVVSLDDEGNVYAGGYSGNNIKKFSKTQEAGTPNMTNWVNVGGTFLNGIHWADGYAYISPVQVGGAGSIQRFPSDTLGGDLDGIRELIGTASTPYSIGTDAEGNIYANIYDTSSVVKYILPQNLAELTIPGTTGLLNITLPEGNHITSHSVAAPIVEDEAYEYPFGLVSFTFNTTSGSTVPVEVTFQTELAPEDVTPRKYNSITETYQDIPDAEVTATTVGGQPALLLSYDITDGGELDEDGDDNGVIVDPVALGVAINNTPDDDSDTESDTDDSSGSGTGAGGNTASDLADTGIDGVLITFVSMLLICSSLSTLYTLGKRATS